MSAPCIEHCSIQSRILKFYINCTDDFCYAFGHFVKLNQFEFHHLPDLASLCSLDYSSFFESTIAGSGSFTSIVFIIMSFDSFVVISTSSLSSLSRK